MSNVPIENKENPLSKNFTMGSLLKFALPTMVMMLCMGLYTIGDTVIIARFVNTDALSALNIVTPVINLIVGLGAMLATGGSAIVAKKMGEGNEKGAAQDFTLIVLAGAILGIVIALVGSLFLNNILRGLGASEVLFPYCKQYLLLLLLFTPFSMLQVLFQSLIVTAGRPGFGMVLSLSAGAINILLDYIFVAVLDMGIVGAALGTGVGYLIPTIIGLFFFAKGTGNLRFHKPVFHWRILWESSSNGFSELVSQGAAAVTTFLFNLIMMGLLGEKGVASITIIIYTQFLLTALYIGFSMGVAPIISYQYGSREGTALKNVVKLCLRFICILSAGVFVVAMALGGLLVSIFSPKGTEVYAIARQGFSIFPISFLFCGVNIFASALFTALSNGRVSAVISTLRTFVFITAGLLVLPPLLGVIGVWVAVPVAELLTIGVSFTYFIKYKGKYQYR